MIKIHLANQSKQGMGGGWTFMRNLRLALEKIKADVEFVEEPQDCDIYFISGATMIQRDSLHEMKDLGKKIVLRIDNIPRNSRNRNTGTTRLYDFAQKADHVIFQSQWAKDKMMPLIASKRSELNTHWNQNIYGDGEEGFKEENSSIIINGVDTSIFRKDGEVVPHENDRPKRFLIMRFNRDNNKRLEEALDMYTAEWIKDKQIDLFIIGQYSADLIQGMFDFYLGEKFQHLGVVADREQLAMYMRSCDIMLFPSYSDACPNQVLEARACGLDIWHNNLAGIPEVMDENLDITLERMGNEYLKVFKKVWGH